MQTMELNRTDDPGLMEYVTEFMLDMGAFKGISLFADGDFDGGERYGSGRKRD